MSAHTGKPTFRELREIHGISLDEIIADTPELFSVPSIQRFDLYGEGEPILVDTLLASLTRLSGQSYHRGNVAFRFILTTHGRARPDSVRKDPLPDRPTLQD